MRDTLEIKKITPQEWAHLAESAHLVVFDEKRPASMDRIDFCLLVLKGGAIMSYATIRELDSETCYWQYGGSIPAVRGTPMSYLTYKKVHDWCFANGYKRITTYVENTNIAMLKFALKIGLRIIGTRTFKNSIYVELLKEGEA